VTVTVYSQPGCGPCSKVKKWLDTKQIGYTEYNVQEDPQALQTITEMGYAGVPVIVAGEDHWAGINLEKMKGLL